ALPRQLRHRRRDLRRGPAAVIEPAVGPVQLQGRRRPPPAALAPLGRQEGPFGLGPGAPGPLDRPALLAALAPAPAPPPPSPSRSAARASRRSARWPSCWMGKLSRLVPSGPAGNSGASCCQCCWTSSSPRRRPLPPSTPAYVSWAHGANAWHQLSPVRS